MPRSQSAGAGPKDLVLSIFQPGVVVTLDDACAEADRGGFNLAREQIRNALHYLVRTKRIETVGRAAWRLRDTEDHRQSPTGWNGDHRDGASIVGT